MDLSILFLKKSVLMIINDLFRILELLFLTRILSNPATLLAALHEFIDNNGNRDTMFFKIKYNLIL